MLTDPQSLYQFFNLGPNFTVKELTKAYIDKRRITPKENKEKLRLLWKIQRDRYFRTSYQKYQNTTTIIEAGFFDDGTEPEDKYTIGSPNWLTTPVVKILNNLTPMVGKRPFAILLSTGAFSPIHESHIKMMEIAKEELEHRGVRVLGGYLSPSHDSYVSSKSQQLLRLGFAHRTYLCKKAISDSNWLMVDDWEGRFNKVPVTYTDVMEHLEMYLRKHLPKLDFNLYYVFGSDNCYFSRGFIGKGKCVCVRRPGFEKNLKRLFADPLIKGNRNILLSSVTTLKPGQSSTAIRNGNQVHLTNKVGNDFVIWKKRLTKNQSMVKSGLYALRDDTDWSLDPWKKGRSKDEINNARVALLKGIVKSVNSSFAQCILPDLGVQHKIIIINISDQQKYVNWYSKERPSINIDLCTHGSYSLNISRLFNLSDGQLQTQIVTNRPGYPEITQQINSIPKGQYTIIDDDIATGTTISRIIALLPERIVVKEKISLLAEYLRSHHIDRERLIDINDCRDFIVGAKDAGLVMELPNKKICRAPYLLPYVSPATRSMIPLSSELSFSKLLWQLNHTFFNTVSPPITLGETNKYFQDLMLYVGFTPNVLMANICDWHLKQLESAVN